MLPKRLIIVANGDLEDLAFYEAIIKPDDYIVCVNGGTGHALALGLKPDLVIGDLDSLSAADREEINRLNPELIIHPSEKDKSDLELALDHSVKMEPIEIIIIGALGGTRFEHAFINVLLLYIPLRKRIAARILSENQEVMLVRDELTVQGNVGDFLSLYALTNQADGIFTEGLKYPLKNDSLYFASTLGLSNEFTSLEAKVSLKTGLLLLIKSSAEKAPTDFSWPGH